MKIPEPIIEPATSIVESSNPSPRTSFASLSVAGCDISGFFAFLARQCRQSNAHGRPSPLRKKATPKCWDRSIIQPIMARPLGRRTPIFPNHLNAHHPPFERELIESCGFTKRKTAMSVVHRSGKAHGAFATIDEAFSKALAGRYPTWKSQNIREQSRRLRRIYNQT